MDPQAPLDTPAQGAGFVIGEVMFAALAQLFQDGCQRPALAFFNILRSSQAAQPVSRDMEDAFGQFLGKSHNINTARLDGAFGHRVKLRGLRRLRQCQPALRFDGLQPQSPVRPHARQHHANGTLPLVACER